MKFNMNFMLFTMYIVGLITSLNGSPVTTDEGDTSEKTPSCVSSNIFPLSILNLEKNIKERDLSTGLIEPKYVYSVELKLHPAHVIEALKARNLIQNNDIETARKVLFNATIARTVMKYNKYTHDPDFGNGQVITKIREIVGHFIEDVQNGL